MPERIQRKRTAGWKMPDGAIYVGRPGKYGNPYWHVQRFHGLDLSLKLYEYTAQGIWMPSLLDEMPDGYFRQVYSSHLDWTKRFQAHPLEQIQVELRGKDLACW